MMKNWFESPRNVPVAICVYAFGMPWKIVSCLVIRYSRPLNTWPMARVMMNDEAPANATSTPFTAPPATPTSRPDQDRQRGS